MNALLSLLILFEVICNVAAQITLKIGMSRIGHFDFHSGNIVPITMQVIMSPWIITGIVIYIISMIVWLVILSRIEVSLAYPLTSLGYVLNAVIAYFLLSEQVTVLRFAGIVVILLGVFLVAKS
jgi:drug/metabolite transporter (DMT)-like permease